MRKLSVKFQCILASGRESDARKKSPWLIVVQMNTLYGHCDAASEKKYVPTSIFDSSPTLCWLRHLPSHKGTAPGNDTSENQAFFLLC